MTEMEESLLGACTAWAQERYAPETDAQRWSREQLRARDLPEIQISPLEGRILAFLAASVDARRLLEVGTLGGYSALWLVSLLSPEARLTTIERDPEHARLARETVARAGEEERIEVRIGDARTLLEGLAAWPDREPFDLVFIDADKRSYPDYLEWSCSLLRPGGLVIGDNAFWDGRVLEARNGFALPGPRTGGARSDSESDSDEADADLRGILEFDRRLAEDSRLQAVVIPVRDGIAVARFIG